MFSVGYVQFVWSKYCRTTPFRRPSLNARPAESETDGIFDATRFTIYFFIILFGFFRLDAEICPETVWLMFRLVC